MPPSRLENKGRLQDMKDQEYRLRVALHNVAMGIIDCFQPVDYHSFRYLDKVNVRMLVANMKDFNERHAELMQMVADIKTLESEIGPGL